MRPRGWQVALCRVVSSTQGHEDRDTFLLADTAGDVTTPGKVFGQHDVSRPKDPLRAVAYFDLSLAPQGDDELPGGRMVPLLIQGPFGLSKEDAARLHQVRPPLAHAERFEIDIDIFEMRLAVSSRVKTRCLHDVSFEVLRRYVILPERPRQAPTVSDFFGGRNGGRPDCMAADRSLEGFSDIGVGSDFCPKLFRPQSIIHSMARLHRWRKTKIVCTIGPATASEGMIRKLIEAGMDVARLNLSHGTLTEHAQYVDNVRRLSRSVGVEVAVLLDLPGPKHRIGKLAGGSVLLRKGAETVLTERQVAGDSSLLPVTLPDLVRGLRPGQTILLDDGALQIKALSVKGADVVGRVMVGGVLMEGKGVVVQGMPIAKPFLTDSLRGMIGFAVSQRPDYVALSFVTTPDDVLQVKRVLSERGADIPIISKIERREAVKAFDAILEASDAIMVARGDLGVEMPLEQVPLLQKEFIRKCNRAGKPVITATEMLQSMVSSPRPVRAEASDVANAIFDGTDAVMLSAETSVGKYPVQAVQMMDRISNETEKVLPYDLTLSQRRDWAGAVVGDLIGYDACLTAQKLGAKAIVAFTQSGTTAARVAKYRPRPVILAVTPVDICGRLVLYWGVHPFKRDIPESANGLFSVASTLAKDSGIAKPGDLIVVTGGIPLGQSGSTNLLKVEKVS